MVLLAVSARIPISIVHRHYHHPRHLCHHPSHLCHYPRHLCHHPRHLCHYPRRLCHHPRHVCRHPRQGHRGHPFVTTSVQEIVHDGLRVESKVYLEYVCSTCSDSAIEARAYRQTVARANENVVLSFYPIRVLFLPQLTASICCQPCNHVYATVADGLGQLGIRVWPPALIACAGGRPGELAGRKLQQVWVRCVEGGCLRPARDIRAALLQQTGAELYQLRWPQGTRGAWDGKQCMIDYWHECLRMCFTCNIYV